MEHTFCTDCCLRDQPAFCTGACPFGLDLRDMMEKLQRGRFDPAYRALFGVQAGGIAPPGGRC